MYKYDTAGLAGDLQGQLPVVGRLVEACADLKCLNVAYSSLLAIIETSLDLAVEPQALFHIFSAT